MQQRTDAGGAPHLRAPRTPRPAGLVYRHFGREVIANLMGLQQDDPNMEAIYLQVYKVRPGACGRRRCVLAARPVRSSAPPRPPSCCAQTFIECVDATDNGVGQWDTAEAPRYVNNTTLSARVARLNPRQVPEHTAAPPAPSCPHSVHSGSLRTKGGTRSPARSLRALPCVALRACEGRAR